MKQRIAKIGALIILFAPAGKAVSSDTFWERFFGMNNPVCRKINVSGHRYCLPKTVQVVGTGEHVARMLFHPAALPPGEFVYMNLMNARVVGHATDGETVPERYVRGTIQSIESRQNTNGARKRKADDLIRNNPDFQIINMSDLLRDERFKSHPYIITNNKRVTHFVDCNSPNQFGLRSCRSVSQLVGENLYVDFFLVSKIKDDDEFIQLLLRVEREFRNTLKASAVSDSKDI